LYALYKKREKISTSRSRKLIPSRLVQITKDSKLKRKQKAMISDFICFFNLFIMFIRDTPAKECTLDRVSAVGLPAT